MPTPIARHDFALPITNEEHLKTFIRLAWGAIIPDVQVCPNHSTPWRAFCDAYFARASVTIWKASRGFGGKSYLLALLGLTEAVTLKCDVNVLGGSGEQSKRVLEYSQEFWDYEGAPKHLLASDVMRETRIAWGNKIQALMASSKSVRGPHVPRLRFDEGDETDIKILDAAMGQPMEKDGVPAQTVISSTHHYADGTFTEVLKRAAEKGWPVHTWCIDGNCDIMGMDKSILMKNIQMGDYIYAYSDGRIIETRVRDSWQSGIRKTVAINTARGELRCTPEHKILTPRGWRRAENIKAGELVYTVRNAQSDTSGTAMQDVSLRQSMRRLWKANRHKFNPLQVVCIKAKSHSANKETNRENDLSYMRWSQAVTLEKLCSLLQKRIIKKEHPHGGHNGAGKRAHSTEREQPQTQEQWREDGGTAFRATRFRVSIPAAIRALCSRFRIARLLTCHRSEWAILAQQTETNRARQEKASSSRKSWNENACLMDRSIPSLDFAVVRSVRDGGFAPVYDLTVDEGHSFIANGIVVHNCYHETSAPPTGWLSEAEIERKRNEVTAAMFSVEFDLNEPSPESRAIQPDKVAAMFKKSLGTFKGKPGEYIEIEGPKWYCRRHPRLEQDVLGDCPKCKRKLRKARYATGADWARKKDWTVIITLRVDTTPARLVAFERCQRLPWPAMVAKFERQIERYGSNAVHDGTGLGDVVDGYLNKEAEAFIMVGRARSDLLSNYISDIEDGAIEAPFIEFMESSHRLASVDDVYGSGHLPDDIAAGALAWRAGKVTWWVR